VDDLLAHVPLMQKMILFDAVLQADVDRNDIREDDVKQRDQPAEHS